jgi:hypothetical protein
MNIFSPHRCGTLKLQARVTKPSESFRSLLPARSLIHIPKRYRVKAGNIITKDEYSSWIIADHHGYGLNNVFLGLPVNAYASVKITIRKLHPVTQLETNGFDLETQEIPCCKELETPDEIKGLRVSREVYYFGTEITDNSLIDGRTITKLTKIAGIYRAEV